MARKPIQHELVGMLTPRERVWQAIRKLREFSLLELQDAIHPVVAFGTCESYLQWLGKAGFIESSGEQVRSAKSKWQELRYRLKKDAFEAPRVTRAGGLVTQGIATLAMWRAMKALGEFDHVDIQRASSVGECQVKSETAKAYVNALARAGYFRTIRASKPGTPSRYRLIRDTGAHPPAITRRKSVFDRNIGKFTWEQSAQEVCDGLE